MSARILTPVATDPLTLLGPSVLTSWVRDAATISAAVSLQTGTLPPALVLSGNLAFGSNMPGVKFECTVGGANPTLRYSADNGGSFIATISPTPGVPTALSGILAAVNVTAPVGAYNANNRWWFGCQSYTDLSGNGHHWVAPSAAGCPLIVPEPTLGQPYLDFNGTANYLECASLPGPNPDIWVMIHRTDVWTNGRNIKAANGGVLRHLLQMSGSTPTLVQNNGGANLGNGLATVGTWNRLVQYFHDSIQDYFLVAGNMPAVFDDTGGNTGTGGRIGTNASATSFANISMCEGFQTTRDLSIFEWQCLDMYFLARYGASLGLG